MLRVRGVRLETKLKKQKAKTGKKNIAMKNCECMSYE